MNLKKNGLRTPQWPLLFAENRQTRPIFFHDLLQHPLDTTHPEFDGAHASPSYGKPCTKIEHLQILHLQLPKPHILNLPTILRISNKRRYIK